MKPFCRTLLFFALVPHLSSAAPDCGTELARFRGVAAFSNGAFQGKPLDCGITGGADGDQFQCVEYVRRFYRQAVGLDTSRWKGNAIDYLTFTNKGLVRHDNGVSTFSPRPSDILVFKSATSVYGHVAIVTEVSTACVSLIEQNWSATGIASLPYSRDPVTGAFIINARGSYEVIAWLRLPTPVLFTNRGAFNAASVNRSVIHFEGLAPSGGYTFYGSPGSLSLSGITYQSNGPLFVQNAGGAAGSRLSFQQAPPTNILNISLPAGVSAVGFDFLSNDQVTVIVITGHSSHSFKVGSSPWPNFLFLGFTAGEPIGALQIVTELNGADLDNFTFGSAFAP